MDCWIFVVVCFSLYIFLQKFGKKKQTIDIMLNPDIKALWHDFDLIFAPMHCWLG